MDKKLSYSIKMLKFYVIKDLIMMQKTLIDLIEILLSKKRIWNIETNLKIVIGGTEIGSIGITGKIEYIPSEEKKSN
jgi:hypothetical protein